MFAVNVEDYHVHAYTLHTIVTSPLNQWLIINNKMSVIVATCSTFTLCIAMYIAL